MNSLVLLTLISDLYAQLIAAKAEAEQARQPPAAEQDAPAPEPE